MHGVGGALGALLTGVFASNAINSGAHGWLIDGNFDQMLIQVYDVVGTFVYCAIVTFIILKVIDIIVGLAGLRRGRSRRSRHQPPRRNRARLRKGYFPDLGAPRGGAPFSFSDGHGVLGRPH